MEIRGNFFQSNRRKSCMSEVNRKHGKIHSIYGEISRKSTVMRNTQKLLLAVTRRASWIIWFRNSAPAAASWALAFRLKVFDDDAGSRSGVGTLAFVWLSMFQSYCSGRYMDLGFANSITGNRIEHAFVEGLRGRESSSVSGGDTRRGRKPRRTSNHVREHFAIRRIDTFYIYVFYFSTVENKCSNVKRSYWGKVTWLFLHLQ